VKALFNKLRCRGEDTHSLNKNRDEKIEEEQCETPNTGSALKKKNNSEKKRSKLSILKTTSTSKIEDFKLLDWVDRDILVMRS